MKEIFRAAIKKKIVANSLKIALAVGTVLNLVNQWNAIFGGAEFSLLHGVLNYLVPFCVASYSAGKNQVANQRDADQ